jgi:hypothetical protein
MAGRFSQLPEEHGVVFNVSPSPEWPECHRDNFEAIRNIGRENFHTFCASIDIRSADEPWRGQLKHRAEWLASRAAQLSIQQRNEEGWRLGLENVVLHRFSVEVAW